MARFDFRLPTGVAILAALLAGCVADDSPIPRSAMWKTHSPEAEKDWLGREKPPNVSPRLYVEDARLAERSGNHEGARRSYEAALGSDPRSVDAILGIARLDQLAGRTKEAEQGFHKALRMRPKDPAVLDAVGQYYAAKEKWSEAIQHLNQATLEAPHDTTCRYHLAIAMTKSGDPEGALPHFTRCVGEAEAHYNIGYILHQKGNLTEAERHFTAAVVKKPDLVVAQAMLDEIRHTQGRNQIIPASSESQPKRERRMPLPMDRKIASKPPRKTSDDNEDFGAPPPRRTGRSQESRRSAELPITPSEPEPPAWEGGAASERDFDPPANESPAEPPAWDTSDLPTRHVAPFAPGAFDNQRAITEPEPYGAQPVQWPDNQPRR